MINGKKERPIDVLESGKHRATESINRAKGVQTHLLKAKYDVTESDIADRVAITPIHAVKVAKDGGAQSEQGC